MGIGISFNLKNGATTIDEIRNNNSNLSETYIPYSISNRLKSLFLISLLCTWLHFKAGFLLDTKQVT